MLFIKERYGVSHEAYREMSKACSSLPTQYKIQKAITEFNSKWDIHPTPNGVPGFQQKLEGCLRDRLRHLIESTPDDAPFKSTRTISVKLSGDGTRIGECENLLMTYDVYR